MLAVVLRGSARELRTGLYVASSTVLEERTSRHKQAHKYARRHQKKKYVDPRRTRLFIRALLFRRRSARALCCFVFSVQPA